MKKTWLRFALGLLLASPLAARADTQFRGVVKEAFTLMAGPGEKFPAQSYGIVEKEVVLVLGSSTGGLWLNVMKEDGTEGWAPKTKFELYRVPTFELDDMEQTFQRKRRILSSWILETGLIVASAPNAVGAGINMWAIPFEKGLLSSKIDQLEFGTGVRFAYAVNNHTEIKERTYAEMPFAVQWMFRMPPRGSLMAGPRLGVTLIQDHYDPSRDTFAFEWGVGARYFPYDTLGFFAELVTVQRMRLFVTRQAGLSFRF